MNTQETALPQRVVRSAKDLACATLSGTFELNDLQDRKHAGTSTQASYDEGYHSSGTVRSRSVLGSRQNSFRDELNATKYREAEEDFNQFQALKDFQEWQSAEFVASITSLRDANVPQGSSYASQDVFHTPLDLQFDTVVDGHVISTSVTDKPTSITSSATGPAYDTDSDLARKAALRRLHQIGAHLQKNLAMQVLQQAAFEQSTTSMHRGSSHVQHQHTQQYIDGNHDPIRSDKVGADCNINQENQSSQQAHESISRAKEAPALPSEKEETALQRQFHCPYYACHSNLQLLSTHGSSSNQRPCVHVGCGFQGDTFNSWAEHVQVPHHDLLGSS